MGEIREVKRFLGLNSYDFRVLIGRDCLRMQASIPIKIVINLTDKKTRAIKNTVMRVPNERIMRRIRQTHEAVASTQRRLEATADLLHVARRRFWVPEAIMIPSPQHHLCRICGEIVDLEACKTDEHGNMVHEECYAKHMKLATAAQENAQKTP